VIGIPFIVAIFVALAVLKQRNQLTMGRTWILGTLAMFFVFVSSGSSNGQPLWAAAAGGAILALLAGIPFYFLLQYLEDRRHDQD
jgi:hypothetical protein